MYDPNAATKAKLGFQDFLYRHPNSEKAAQARENLKKVEHNRPAPPSRSPGFTTSKSLIGRRPSIIMTSFASNPNRPRAKRLRRESPNCAPNWEKRLAVARLTAATATKKKGKRDADLDQPRSQTEVRSGIGAAFRRRTSTSRYLRRPRSSPNNDRAAFFRPRRPARAEP